ncbi:DUF4296 domain-containing protein [Flavobacterium amnicola]|uniref:DUF4296 domain-containing protein n=1 Tax=Flavobacterium amnicola TaxID=2506422 RepID=A0A4V1N278_9FLAO|nr:DUF4296 domain-containing protein [Flavobacterium amnicola]RXR20771.1 DUF4296 domain-containing protein [Flavobacterium amnicola]
MKLNLIIIALSFVLFSCGNKELEKPEKLIAQETMEKIIYDLAMLQAIKGHDATLLPKNSINPKTYIYQKYKVDSTQFAESNAYYSSDITLYKTMFDNVIEKMSIDKKVIDAKVRKDFEAKQKRKRDSIKKINKSKKSNVIATG